MHALVRLGYRVLAILLLSVSSNLLPFPLASAEAPTADREILVVPAFKEQSGSSGQLEAWLGYAMARMVWIDGKFHEHFPEDATYQYSFSEELYARDALVAIWTDLKTEQGLGDRYLEDLSRVYAAGFLKEYVWLCIGHPSWQESPGLPVKEFGSWMRDHLPSHKVETWVSVRKKGDSYKAFVGHPPHPARVCSGI